MIISDYWGKPHLVMHFSCSSHYRGSVELHVTHSKEQASKYCMARTGLPEHKQLHVKGSPFRLLEGVPILYFVLWSFNHLIFPRVVRTPIGCTAGYNCTSGSLLDHEGLFFFDKNNFPFDLTHISSVVLHSNLCTTVCYIWPRGSSRCPYGPKTECCLL